MPGRDTWDSRTWTANTGSAPKARCSSRVPEASSKECRARPEAPAPRAPRSPEALPCGISRSSRTRWSLAGSSPCPFDELNRQTVVVAWLTPSSRLVKLRGPEGAQRQRATSASEFEFGGTLPERSLVRIREFDPRLPLGCLAQRECALGSGTLGVGSGGRPKRGRRRGLCDALAPAGLNPPLVLWEGACACS
jgi:hypothetical protein